MAIVEIHPQPIFGRFAGGIALDLHTTSSTPVGHNAYGHMQFDTLRPPIAELLYQLKYHADKDAASSIVDTAVEFLQERRGKFDLIVPVPPSTARAVQPVLVLAEGIGAALKVPVISCVTTTGRRHSSRV
jgi:predicted amidophosphoribosyltransferase